MRARRTLLVAAVAVLLTGGCASEGDEQTTAQEITGDLAGSDDRSLSPGPTGTAPGETGRYPAWSPSECLPVTPEQATTVLSQENFELTPGVTLEAVNQAAMEFQPDAYFVAIDFTADGEPQTGVWMVASLDDPMYGLQVVDQTAATYTGWSSAVEGYFLDGLYDAGHPGVAAVKGCLPAG